MSHGDVEIYLFQEQLEVLNELSRRIRDRTPTIVWAGRQAGMSTLYKYLSYKYRDWPQIIIGSTNECAANMILSDGGYIHPSELEYDSQIELGKWDLITPYTLVFMDNMLHLPNAESLYKRICAITPYVIINGQMPIEGNMWSLKEHLMDLIGPYATWELNVELDDRALTTYAHNNNQHRPILNQNTMSCLNVNSWKHWVK